MPTPNDHRTGRRLSLPDRVRSLATILLDEFGVPFRFFDAGCGEPVPPADRPSDGPGISPEDCAWVVHFGVLEQSGVSPMPGAGYRLALSLHEEGRPSLVAFGLKTSVAQPNAEATHEEAMRLERWLRAIFDRLRIAGQTECRHRAETAKPAVASDAWEVIVRLEQLMRVQKTHKEPDKNRRRVLRSAIDLVSARSLIFVPTRSKDPVVAAGEEILSPWDSTQLATLLARSHDWEETGYLLINDPSTSPWAGRFPQVANLVAFPVLDGIPVGWLIAMNKTTPTGRAVPRPPGPTEEGPSDAEFAPFRRTDAAMLAPFASLLGHHSRAYQGYNHLRELMVGLTRSLTAAIDAKDSYTYGHSERVARIAVELGRELGLPEDDLSDIYLAGLLHDIGKIGIRDEILGKKSPLDDSEFEHIKEHVTIGYRILSGVHSIEHLLPGVLHHHERYDGKGYPEGLKGNAIPFLARILAVADSYDAMSTSRPYRVALPCEQVEQILVQGADQQWEKAIIDAFVRCKDRVHAIRQRGVGESLCGALDDALRRGNGRKGLSSMVSILAQ